MDLGPQVIYLHNPSATSLQAGLETGEYSINGIIPLIASQVTQCDILCARPCLPQQITIDFADVDFGTCNDCNKSVGFHIKLERNPDFDLETFLHQTSSLPYFYEPEQAPTGVVSAQTIRNYFVNLLTTVYDDEHDNFGIVASAHPTDVSMMVLDIPCPYRVDVYQDVNSQPITIAETEAGQTAILTYEQLVKQYPIVIGYVPGQDLDETHFSKCETACIITLKGCIDPCVVPAKDLLTTENAVPLHAVGTKFDIQLAVNSNAPGYTDFITALNTAVSACTLTAIRGSQLPNASVTATAGTDSLDLTPFMSATAGEFSTGAGPISGRVSNGNVTLNFNLTVPPLVAPITTANLVTALNAMFAGGFAVNGGDANLIDVLAPFGPTGAFVMIEFTNV